MILVPWLDLPELLLTAPTQSSDRSVQGVNNSYKMVLHWFDNYHSRFSSAKAEVRMTDRHYPVSVSSNFFLHISQEHPAQEASSCQACRESSATAT